MRMLNELADYPLMKQVRGSDSTDDEQVTPPFSLQLQRLVNRGRLVPEGCFLDMPARQYTSVHARLVCSST